MRPELLISQMDSCALIAIILRNVTAVATKTEEIQLRLAHFSGKSAFAQ